MNGKSFTRLTLLAVLGVSMRLSAQSIQFIENKNQWHPTVDFGATLAFGDLMVAPGQLSFRFLDQRQLELLHQLTHEPDGRNAAATDCFIEGRVATIQLSGINNHAVAYASNLSSTYYNFFQGADPAHWAGGARAFGEVTYRSIYQGIDWRITSDGDNLKYDFMLQPGADPGQIKLRYQGIDQVVEQEGDLYITAGFVQWIEKEPLAFQMINGKKVVIPCSYKLSGGEVTFDFPVGFDSCLPLTIDPLLIFATYSGSQADNWGSSATPGEHGRLYSTGVTNHFVGNTFSGVFPASFGAFQTHYGGLYDVALLKYDSTGTQLLYASYLGGAASESPHSLVMNSNEELVVLGTTSSSDFPTTANAYDRSFKGGEFAQHVVVYSFGSDLFISKISSDGRQLIASTYLGGSENDGINQSDGPLTANYGDQLRGDVICDEAGNVFFSSVTASSDFPMVGGFNAAYKGGGSDALVTKLKPDLSAIVWSSFVGGLGTDAAHSIKVAPSGDIFVAGGTTSTNFPTTATSYQKNFSGDVDGWIARIRADGTVLQNATLTGTFKFDQVYFLDLNQAGDVFVYGQTSGTFPITAGVYSNPNSGQFVQKFSSDLSTLLFSTVFGSGRGIPDISPTAFLVNDCNNIYMSGWGGKLNANLGFWNSDTRNLPVSSDAYQKVTSGGDFYFIVLTDDAREFLYGTYLGGANSATHVDGGTSRFDKSGIVYHAVCSGCVSFNTTGTHTSDFPTTPGAWSAVNRSKNCNNAAFKFDLSSLRARILTNNVKLNKPGVRIVCLPDEIVFQNKSTGGEIYQWDLGDGTRLIKPDTARITHLYPAPGTYTVKLKALDQGTCIGKDSTSVAIEVSELIPVVSEDVSICFGASYRLAASGGSGYQWKSADALFTSTDAAPLIAPVDTMDYYVTITNNKGCAKKDTVTVAVVPSVDLDFASDKIYDCDSRPRLWVKNLTDGKKGESFTFDFGDGTRSELNEDIHVFESDQVFAVRLLVQKEFCVYEEKRDVPIFKISAPNVITPADRAETGSKNDTFRFQYGLTAAVDPDLKVRLAVYNRWGHLVYESKDYKGDWGAEGLEGGIYYYELEIEGETTCKSWIHVVK